MKINSKANEEQIESIKDRLKIIDSKKSAVEWVIDQMFKQGYFDGNKPLSITNLDHLQYQAKEMEKQQHGKTWDSAIEQGEKRAWNISRLYTDFDDYFAETYGSKGSDEKGIMTPENHVDVLCKAINSQTEISDEEIEKSAKEWYEKEGRVNYNAEIRAWIMACKWYREQLKNK